MFNSGSAAVGAESEDKTMFSGVCSPEPFMKKRLNLKGKGNYMVREPVVDEPEGPNMYLAKMWFHE